MNSEMKQAFWAKLKTVLLALVLTFFLVAVVMGHHTENKKGPPKNQSMEQRVSKLEAALRDNREMLREAKEANRTLREMLSELRGIHNDCQRNATETFLREHRNQNAR